MEKKKIRMQLLAFCQRFDIYNKVLYVKNYPNESGNTLCAC